MSDEIVDEVRPWTLRDVIACDVIFSDECSGLTGEQARKLILRLHEHVAGYLANPSDERVDAARAAIDSFADETCQQIRGARTLARYVLRASLCVSPPKPESETR